MQPTPHSTHMLRTYQKILECVDCCLDIIDCYCAYLAGPSEPAQHAALMSAWVNELLFIAGPIKLYNAYQSSTFNKKRNPASAAIDGNIHTASQTAVDTDSCTNLNDQGDYGACGLLGECVASPYYTGSYASTPSNPYWTAGFSSDISVSFQPFHKD